MGIILLIDYNTAHEVGKPLKWNVSLKGHGSANCGVLQDFYPGFTHYNGKKMLCITTNIFMFQFFTYKVSRTNKKFKYLHTYCSETKGVMPLKEPH